mmetsp:Transcript_14455/g.36858  ORF Transcript_14455/g.36858 Transcript_14455/m.36858 type:complete len:80 (+) Transcript_14455:377-616(+)
MVMSLQQCTRVFIILQVFRARQTVTCFLPPSFPSAYASSSRIRSLSNPTSLSAFFIATFMDSGPDITAKVLDMLCSSAS